MQKGLRQYCSQVLTYFRRDVILIGLLLATITLGIGVELLQAWPMAVLVDSVLSPTPHWSWAGRLFLALLPHQVMGQVIGLTLIGLGLKVIRDFMTLARNLINRRVEFNGLVRLRFALFNKLQSLGPEYHNRQPQGEAIYRVTFDANGAKDVFNILLNTSFSAVRLIMMVIIMLSRSWALTAVAMSVFPVLLLVNWVYGPRIRRSAATSKQQEADYTTTLQRSLSVLPVVQAFAREKRDFGLFKLANLRCIGGWMKFNVDVESYWFLIRTVFTVGTAIIFGYGGYLIYRDQFVLHKAAGITCGDLMVFVSYLSQLWDPLTDITSFHANIQAPLAAVDRVLAVMDRRPAVVDAPGARDLPVQPRVLGLDHVSFSHGQGKSTLRDVSATILPGQMVAFVGPSGAGKSTLLSLLNRWRDPAGGRVHLDGRDLRDLRLSSVRRHVAVVSQDSPLLPMSIAENIAYGHCGASFDDIRAAAKMAGADEFIADLPDGYGTQIVEGAQNLSGGQRQRIAIARAILSRAPIILLDEPTSALDAKHAQRIMETLNELRRDRTIALVTHDMRSVAQCDRIFVLDEGRLAEEGTHEELSRARGVYWSLLNAQNAVPEEVEAMTQAA